MRAISAVVGLVVLVAAVTAAQEAGRPSPSLLKASFFKLPIYFIENRGVYPEEVAYYIQGADKTLFFTKDGITFRLKDQDRGWVVKLEFVGANREVVPRGEDPQQAVFSYFKGPDKDWKKGLKTFAKVVYQDLWPGIDLVYRGSVNRLKYEFLVKPGADPGQIKLRYRGATQVEFTKPGGLRLATPVGDFEDEPPLAWQVVDGDRVPVAVTYSLVRRDAESNVLFGFRVGQHDPDRTLILDPVILVYCGYIGGSDAESVRGIAVDAAGNAYVTGCTLSDEQSFPVRVGPDLSYNDRAPYTGDAFVAKVDAQGKALIYCGYIGGADNEWGFGIAVDAAGSAHVTGVTRSAASSFPVCIGPDLVYNGGTNDGFVAKVNPAGTALVYCGYIGGASNDAGQDIAVNARGHAFVVGITYSDQTTFPVRVGPDLTHNGSFDAFVAKVNAAGTAFDYCGYIGGAFGDDGFAISVDPAGSAYVTGQTASDEKSFPVRTGPDLTYNGGGDAFLAKVNPAGTALVYCGYIGGAMCDQGEGIAVDSQGNAFVVGWACSDEKSFPVKNGPDLDYNGGYNDTFVAKVNPAGTALDYCGYIGGAANDVGYEVAVDANGNAVVTGNTASDHNSFPVKSGPDTTYNGGSDAFLAMVDAQGKALVYCGYVGGTGVDRGYGITVGVAGNIHLAGDTNSAQSSFPVTVGPGLIYKGKKAPGYLLGGDAFVATISQTRLEGRGTTRPGGRVALALTASNDARIPYQLGTSLGIGPICIDTRQLNLSPDNLLLVTANDYWPSVFSSYRGVIDSKGQAQATIHIPNVPALIGLRLHSAFVTLDRAAPSGIRSISNTFSFSVTK